jgi:hypothetical protein
MGDFLLRLAFGEVTFIDQAGGRDLPCISQTAEETNRLTITQHFWVPGEKWSKANKHQDNPTHTVQ